MQLNSVLTADSGRRMKAGIVKQTHNCKTGKRVRQKETVKAESKIQKSGGEARSKTREAYTI